MKILPSSVFHQRRHILYSLDVFNFVGGWPIVIWKKPAFRNNHKILNRPACHKHEKQNYNALATSFRFFPRVQKCSCQLAQTEETGFREKTRLIDSTSCTCSLMKHFFQFHIEKWTVIRSNWNRGRTTEYQLQ
jgi:hypothetical protein